MRVLGVDPGISSGLAVVEITDGAAPVLVECIFQQIGLHGEHGPGAKLSAVAVEQIRLLKGILPQQQIAQRFGITQSNISAILTRKTWAYDEAPDPAPTPTPEKTEATLIAGAQQ